MSLSRVIEVSFNGGSIAYVKADTAYFYNNGIIFKPTDIELPTSYQVHWADSPQATSTLETIGTAEGAPIPDDLWDRNRVIYGWIYLHPTEDSGVTAYEVRIYKNARAGMPDGTEPTPAEQSTIDQLIGALNSAVEQAEDAQEAIENMSVSATTLAEGESATVTKSEQDGVVHLAFGIPKGQTGDDGYSPTANVSKTGKVATITITDKNGTTSAQVEDGTDGIDGISPSVSVTDITGGHRVVITDKDGAKSFDVEDGETGATPNLTIGTVETLEPAESATATITGTPENPVLNLGIPQGEQGEVTLADLNSALIEKAPVITDTASGSIASFSDGADDLPLKSLVVDINPIQDLSHGDPSPENICPISGWTEVDVEQRGKNLLPFPYAAETTTRFGITYTVHNDGTVTVSGTATQDSWFELTNAWQYDAKVLDDKTIYVSGCPSGGSDSTYKLICVPTGHKDTGNGFTVSGFKARWFRFQIQVKSGTTVNNLVFKPMVIFGSTPTPYSPYTGRSITINLGQTVYGGKLDVLSGVLTVDMAMVDLGTLNWEKQTLAGDIINFRCRLSGVKTVGNNLVANIVAPFYRTVSAHDMTSQINNYTVSLRDETVEGLRIQDSRYTDATAFKSAMNGVMLCYELAEPIEIQLSPNQINSLLGVNNIWADSGDTEVEYRADTKLFIERLTAPDSADMIADANITSGQYFMVGNSLYKATANIANGSAIVVGTNCIRKSLSEALNEINA